MLFDAFIHTKLKRIAFLKIVFSPNHYYETIIVKVKLQALRVLSLQTQSNIM